MPTVKVAQGLLNKALTITRARPAMAMMRIKMTAIAVATPVTRPTSLREISIIEAPSYRTEANRMTISWTAPATTAPIKIHSAPGRYPN